MNKSFPYSLIVQPTCRGNILIAIIIWFIFIIISLGDVSNHSFDVQFANWRMESIANDDGSSSNEEFYDAKGMWLRECN